MAHLGTQIELIYYFDANSARYRREHPGESVLIEGSLGDIRESFGGEAIDRVKRYNGEYGDTFLFTEVPDPHFHINWMIRGIKLDVSKIAGVDLLESIR